MNARAAVPAALNPAAPHVCPACGRRFVVVRGSAIADAPRCTCGERLAAASLPSGVYELRRPRAVRRPAPEADVPGASQEADLGYGESHGYGPAHGGPTGPGDAPATEPPGAEGEAADRELEGREAGERAGGGPGGAEVDGVDPEVAGPDSETRSRDARS